MALFRKKNFDMCSIILDSIYFVKHWNFFVVDIFMDFPFSVGSDCFSNIKKLEIIDSNDFVININDRTLTLPLLTAISLSTKITQLILKDSTLKEKGFNVEFKTETSIDKIIDVLSKNIVKSNLTLNEEEILDFAVFGTIFGNKEFVRPLYSSLEKCVNSGITVDNVISVIGEKTIVAMIEEKERDIEEEIGIIAKNFSKLCKRPEFIKWCLMVENEEFVDKILNHDELFVNTEDDVLSFVLAINNDATYGRNRFMHLFSNVYLEFCNKASCESFLNFVESNDSLKEQGSRKTMISCIKRYIFKDRMESVSKRRYPQKAEAKEKNANKENDNANVPKPPNFINNIHEAVKTGNYESVLYLVLHDHVSPESKDSRNWTPLHWAAEKGFKAIACFLVSTCKVNVDPVDKNFHTPLHNASFNGHLDVVKFLIEKGHANYEATCDGGLTPLYWAVEQNKMDIVKYLVENCHAKISHKMRNTPNKAMRDYLNTK